MASAAHEPDDCEQVLRLRDREAGVTAIVAVHSTRLGPAHGGIRRWRYDSVEAAHRDAVLLARAMTWKCALADVPAGGGKLVLVDHDGLDREAAYRLVGRAVEQLGGRFFTGPDVGTTDDDLRVVARETKNVVAVGDDGPGDLAAATAHGVFAAMTALAERLQQPMAGLRVVVQGVGRVGMQLCSRLSAVGARLTVSDVAAPRALAAATVFGAAVVDAEAVLETPCDVFAPCALGGVLTVEAATKLPARGVCGAANNIFADDDAALVLHRRSVLAVPDFIANAGALIVGCLWHQTSAQVPAERLDRIRDTAAAVLDRAAGEGAPPSVIALQLARERVERAGPRA